MNTELNEKQALERLRQYCSKTEKCKKDVVEKLKSWNLAEKADKIVDVLVKEGFIDEVRFAQSFANDKLRFSKWGKIKIQFALRNKGISDSVIQTATENIVDDEYMMIVEKELIKKNKSIKDSEPYKRKQKLFAFAYQRGYDSNLAGKIIDGISHQKSE
jgi:regulatory protein